MPPAGGMPPARAPRCYRAATVTRLDRALGVLLLLSQGRPWTAARLAQHFEVTERTIYRDIELLGELGVPVVGERGAGGGYRLLEGFVLPPLNLTRREAIALVLGVTILHSLNTTPFRAALETAEGKLLSALPGDVRRVLARARELIAFERVAEDTFHRERTPPQPGIEAEAVDAYVQAILDGVSVRVAYASPYRAGPETLDVVPLGLLWDRDRWYLVADAQGEPETRMLRADRVTAIHAVRRLERAPADDVRALLGRSWLGGAMRRWIEAAPEPVRLRLTPEQAERLRRDWFYGRARFELVDGEHRVTYAEASRERVFELVRWLGPGAELLEPAAWREALREQFASLAVVYGDATG